MTGSLRVLVVDDEKMARKRVVRLLESLGGNEVVAECSTGEEALRLLDPASVDVAILDVDMPGMNGLETAKVAAQRGVPVIFVTAHQQHALTAFERGAAHYLLKPLDAARLDEALGRVRARRADSGAPERIALPVGADVVLLDIASISHALYDGHLVTVSANAQAVVTDLSLTELESRLKLPQFVRVHRRALLNEAFVRRLIAVPSGGFTARMTDGSEVPVSRQMARELRKKLGL